MTAVQLAFAALRKEKNAAVRETLNDRAIDGNTASIEVHNLILSDSVLLADVDDNRYKSYPWKTITMWVVSLLIQRHLNLMPCVLQNRLHLVSSFFRLLTPTYILVQSLHGSTLVCLVSAIELFSDR